MANTYIAPSVFESKFTCPHCGAIAQQEWHYFEWSGSRYADIELDPIRTSQCKHCEKWCLWFKQTMVYPDSGNAPQSNADLPEAVKVLYSEAASIATKSPRGAAALLRLAVQLLCRELGGKGKDVNEDIAGLVQKGLPDRVQKALDIVRVTGNNAVHPGQIDVDDAEVVGRLFGLVNLIADYMITMPNQVGNIFNSLPENARKQIEARDKNSGGKRG